MDKKTLESLKRHVKELKRKSNSFHHIVAEKIFTDLTKYTEPLDWSLITEDDQPIILIPLKIPKVFTNFLDHSTEGSEGAKEKIMQELGDIIVNKGLIYGATHDLDMDQDKCDDFLENIKKELGE